LQKSSTTCILFATICDRATYAAKFDQECPLRCQNHQANGEERFHRSGFSTEIWPLLWRNRDAERQGGAALWNGPDALWPAAATPEDAPLEQAAGVPIPPKRSSVLPALRPDSTSRQRKTNCSNWPTHAGGRTRLASVPAGACAIHSNAQWISWDQT
jgi:hypothetical protein